MDQTLINMLFNLFPDLYIDDIIIERNNVREKYEISICFLKEMNTYHIAVGERGCYIKAVNELMNKYIMSKDIKTPLTIKCSKST